MDTVVKTDSFDQTAGGDYKSYENDPAYQAHPDDTLEVAEWKAELKKTEEEIVVIKQVLASKTEDCHRLRSKIGVSSFEGFCKDVGKSIQESTASGISSTLGNYTAPAYQKTSEVVKIVGEKTTSVLGSFGGSVARKLGEVKNSNAFKSFEGRVASATGTLKERMTGSRSNNSFDEALNSSEHHISTPATTPNIPEDGPVP